MDENGLPEGQTFTDLLMDAMLDSASTVNNLQMIGDDSKLHPTSTITNSTLQPAPPLEAQAPAFITPGNPLSEFKVSAEANPTLSSKYHNNLPPTATTVTFDSTENGSQSTSRLSRDRDTFTDSHPTPNDSLTSTSLISSMRQETSISPSTQANNSFGTENASSSQKSLNGAKQFPDYSKFRPRSSIPSRLSAEDYAQQCVAAAYASRLNPYALHKGEHALLRDHLCHLHVTTYLNIRNGILRLWTRNPMISVTQEEALGCAKDFRWMNLAAFAHDWLVRNGYINFGCLEIPEILIEPKRGRKKDGPTIVIVGAGMAGLGCARQLEGLFQQYRDNSSNPPKVILLEGRKRIGGRIYSHPLQSLKSDMLPKGLRSTAEMGAQIVVGFDHGNPLDPIIRAQLALRYHLLRDISTIYDIDGSPVDEVRDSMVEKLYNDILDRSGNYRTNAVVAPTAEGDRDLMDSGRDLTADDNLTIRQYEDAAASGKIDKLLPSKRIRKGVGHKTVDIKPPANVSLFNPGATKEHPAALACQSMGWKLLDGISSNATLSLDKLARVSRTQSLGTVMDDAIRQYQKLLPLTAKDMRLLNWHFANLEYANASNIGKLSLSGWDQDLGNEFEGEHAQIIGGYQQVPRALWCFPTPLDVRTNKVVRKISYDSKGSSKDRALVYCDDGETIAADKVVFTAPLGVLKKEAVEFVPPLPDWKKGPIGRLGFGIMNKVIIVFERSFWDVERDMFGLLREPEIENSLTQEDYRSGRGQFYLFWNCIKTSGLPMLIALMAGDSAYQAEKMSDSEILKEVTSQLRNIFKDVAVPDPVETIITRWGQDRFAYGSYSSVAPEAFPDDYDLMAKSIGNLHFAGEATCGTHPATVHGAYLSGLRAASEVLESVIGPIDMPTPLVPPKSKSSSNDTTISTSVLPKTKADTSGGQKKRKRQSKKEPITLTTTAPEKSPSQPQPSSSSLPTRASIHDAYDKAMWDAILGELGPAELRPAKQPLNPFLIFQKDYWHICKSNCDEAKRANSGKPDAKTPRDEIRQALGQMWREASEETRRPYLDQIEANRRTNEESLNSWKERVLVWEKKTYEVKDKWCAENPFEEFEQSTKARAEEDSKSNSEPVRKARRIM